MAKKKKKTSASAPGVKSGIIVNGWAIFAHPLFLDQVDRLAKAIAEERLRKPPRRSKTQQDTPNEKLLAAILESAFERIPGNPAEKAFRQSNTLGENATHWFRDKFFHGRFRLFFRFQSSARVIVLAWVNDETTLRTYGSTSDAYAVFRSMLEAGNPPTSWNELLAESSSEGVKRRVVQLSSEKRAGDRR